MAMYGRTFRRGLPRVAGGDPWPPAAHLDIPAATPDRVEATLEQLGAAAQQQVAAATGAAARRGLPRTPGGEPWPPGETGAFATPIDERSSSRVTASAPSAPVSQAAGPATPDPAEATLEQPGAAARRQASVPTGAAVRRGLPRVPGGEPWPAAGFAPAQAAPTEVAPASASLDDQAQMFAEPERIGAFTKAQWAGVVIIGGIGLVLAAAMAVFAVRWLLNLEPLQDFLQTYPGEYHLPESAPVGFPGWLGWQHFFNAFLMVLIIRSGLQVRTEKRPAAYWTPNRGAKVKISLTLWFHQSLDILWLVNGVVFVVLLFVTGQWMRVIPTSLEVFPNALSAVLQYVSLDWPTENGWVNYNSLQQLAYFTTIFIAAPLAAITGFRMSGLWPKNAKRLSELYPVDWARAVHFPVMLYFVIFIFTHVALVLSTGALRNLNHMFAGQGSVDPSAYAENWTGFWMFVASLVVVAAAWVAVRPLVLAPIARLFGNVSAR